MRFRKATTTRKNERSRNNLKLINQKNEWKIIKEIINEKVKI